MAMQHWLCCKPDLADSILSRSFVTIPMQSLSASTAVTVYSPDSPDLKRLSLAQALVVVDPAVKDLAIVMHGLDDATELLVLDAAADGIEQIGAKLRAYSTLATLHIFAPSCPGVIKLGKICLDRATLEAYRTQIEAWRQALSPRASILLHGQNIAMGTAGMALVGRLSQLTGAVVAPLNLPRAASHSAVPQRFSPLTR